MGYLHIENLYRPEAQVVLLFKECYALEKIHGTSAHVAYKDGNLRFFSGGEKQQSFEALFDKEALAARFAGLGHASAVVYGEAYGGKCQGMSKTYGTTLRFVAFDVTVGDTWLSVPNAHAVVEKLGLEFVHYVKVSTDLAALDAERDAPSVQAVRNGVVDEPKLREGVVLRPLREMFTSSGARVIAKHKRAEFAERKTIPNVDPARRELMEKADAIAAEFVTDMRMAHVLDKLGNPTDLSAIPQVIVAMVEDVTREASGEIVDNKAVRKAIGAAAVKLFKAKVTSCIPA